MMPNDYELIHNSWQVYTFVFVSRTNNSLTIFSQNWLLREIIQFIKWSEWISFVGYIQAYLCKTLITPTNIKLFTTGWICTVNSRCIWKIAVRTVTKCQSVRQIVKGCIVTNTNFQRNKKTIIISNQQLFTHARAHARTQARTHARTHTHTHTFNGALSGTTQVSRYQKGKTNLDFTGTRDSERQWQQLGHMQICT